MARIGLRPDREFQQLGQAILGAWFKALDPKNGVTLAQLKPELDAVVRETLDDQGGALTINVFVDTDTVVNVVIPKWPATVTNINQLIAYLKTYHDTTTGRHYDEDLGQAVVFGCGR